MSRMGWGWGGVGRGVAITPCYASYVCAATSTWGGVGVGWGGAITFMLRCYVRAATRLTFMLHHVTLLMYALLRLPWGAYPTNV